MDTNLEELVHQSEQLTAAIDGESDLPRVERNLKQLAEAGQQLWLRNSAVAPRDTSDVRASVLLGTKGYDLHKVTQQLDSLSAKTKKAVALEAVAETDIKGFLKNERENAIINIIEEVRQSTIEATDKFFWDSLDAEFEQEKIKILNSLVGPADDLPMDETIDISMDLKQTSSMSPKPRLFFEQSFLDAKNISAMNSMEIAYAKETVKYIDHTHHGGVSPNLVNDFLKVVKETVGEQLLIDVWEMILCMLTPELPPPSGPNLLAHRCSSQFCLVMIRQARLYLERKYRQSLEATVFGEPKSSVQTSGVYNLVKNYLNAKNPSWANLTRDSIGQITSGEDGLVEGHPVWLFVWHCLRAGSVDAAIEAFQKCSISSYNNELISILREYKQSPDRRLSPKSENQIRLHYKKTVRLSGDVYKRTVFSLLGCCGVAELQTDVFDRIDDYLWLRLGQVQLYELEKAHDSSFSSTASTHSTDHLTLSKLQLQISEDYGETYFNAMDQPFTYFKVLFLTGQWETAIEFLFRIDRHRPNAVHVAIVLNEIGLLLTSDKHVNVPLLSKQNDDPPNIKRLNYARLIAMYTKKFERTNPTETIYYYYLLRNIKSTKDENLFISYVSSLVRETKNFETLLGYINEEGRRVPGVIDKFQYDANKIIGQVACDCETSGFFEDAVKLYDLDKKHNKVLQILVKMLSPMVPEKKTVDSKRTQLETFALKIAERYCAQGHNADKEVAGTFFLLLDLMTFFDYYHNQQFTDALETITKLKIFPFKSSDVDIKANEFGRYAEEIRRNVPDLLLATMNMLYAQYKELRSITPTSVNKFGIIADTQNREAQCSEIKEKTRALITFSGMIPYRMSGDTNARLLQLQVLMN